MQWVLSYNMQRVFSYTTQRVLSYTTQKVLRHIIRGYSYTGTFVTLRRGTWSHCR